MAKLPSGRFPFINLAKALERGRAIYDNDKGGKGLKMPAAFAAWNYSDKSSGGFQTVGALKMYGILEDEGSKDDRSVKLTQDARRYYLTEIDDEKAKLRATFARHPNLMRHLLERWDNGTVEDNVARSYLKTEINLNDQSARSALSVYKDNLKYIFPMGGSNISPKPPAAEETGDKSEENRSRDVPENPPKSINVGDRVQWISQGQFQFPVPRVVTKVTRDPEHGWFVAVQGSLGMYPMDQIEIAEPGAKEEPAPRPPAGEATANPIEIFMNAENRLQITADLDRAGVDKLRSLLTKYAEILDLMKGS